MSKVPSNTFETTNAVMSQLAHMLYELNEHQKTIKLKRSELKALKQMKFTASFLCRMAVEQEALLDELDEAKKAEKSNG